MLPKLSNSFDNLGNNISVATLGENNLVNDLYFQNIKDVNSFLNYEFFKHLKDDKTQQIKKQLYINIESNIDSVQDILYFFAFIYNKNLTQIELDNLNNSIKNNNNNYNFLIMLPFIVIKSINNNNKYEFVYF